MRRACFKPLRDCAHSDIYDTSAPEPYNQGDFRKICNLHNVYHAYIVVGQMREHGNAE